MALVGMSVWIFLSPLLAISICVVAKCCILTHKSLADKYGSKDDQDSESESDDDLGRPKCRNNRRKLGNNGATSDSKKTKSQKKKKTSKVSDKCSKFRRKSSKAPLLEPFNWDDLFPKHDQIENEAEYSTSGATTTTTTCGQSEDKTSRDYLLSKNILNSYHCQRYGVFDKRKQCPRRPSYGCYTNMGRRMSNDPESALYVDINRNRSGYYGERTVLTNQDPCRRSSSGHHQSSRKEQQQQTRSDTAHHSNNYHEKATHVNLQTYGSVATSNRSGDATNSCVQPPPNNNDLTAADLHFCNTVALPPVNGITPPPPQSRFSYHSVGTLGMMMVASSCSSLASSSQQQCFCDSSLHISLRCRQCQANWLADPAWRSRRSLLAPSSSDSQESERALSIDSKWWGTPTPPPPYDEALRAPEMVHRVELNNEGPPPYNSVYHVKTNSLPFSIATQQIQPDTAK